MWLAPVLHRSVRLLSANQAGDACAVIEWPAAQRWWNGNVGVFGGSYLGVAR